MMKIGITGSQGLIGWHLQCHLLAQSKGQQKHPIEILPDDRELLGSPEALQAWVKSCDVIVHLAGKNRGTEQEVAETNIRLARDLVSALERSGHQPHLLFASSTHIDRDTAYGKSKRECAEVFSKWAQKAGARFTNLVLPHVFGEGGKPFYNSAVSTFCHQLAKNETPTIIQDADLELVHTSQVCEKIWECICSPKSKSQTQIEEIRLKGKALKVSEVLNQLKQFHELYSGELILPKFEDKTDLFLFNTYRSYLYPAHYPVSLKLHTDPRGSLFECLRSKDESHVFISTTVPGITRGNHFHLHKIERFCVISGRGTVKIRKLFTDSMQTFELNGDKPQFIDIPTLHTHNITNTGTDPLLTLFWSNEIFNPAHPDTYSEEVS